ncbi:FtsX-like permease family protein [Tissierella praeacuta]|uniref:ABC transporter permease n=1 Tax=Tissierella praeacuta TaxID=43131 RepID=UPI00333F471D
MNKKNISIIISVFIAALVVSILGYILVTQRLELYNESRLNMPEDITLYSKIDKKIIKEIEKLPNVKEIGLKSDEESMKLDDNIFILEKYDEVYFSMQKNILKEGKFPSKTNEILISEKTSKELNLNIGDTRLLEKGNRLLKGKVISPTRGYNKNEIFEKSASHEYKISGIYKTKNSNNLQRIYSNIDNNNNNKYYPCIKLEKLTRAYETKNDIKEIVGKNNYVIMNESLLRVFSIDENGFNISRFLINMILVPAILIIIFTMMIKNIFNIWGIYKIREFSIYKSIGATNFQIYKLLFKEIFKISVIPLILGEICGLLIIKAVFLNLFSLQQKLVVGKMLEFNFNWSSIILINFILLAILIISTTFPTRVISKIEILDGLKENIKSKKFKKKKSENIFKELRLNNRKLLRPALVVMTVGLILTGSIVCINTIDKYNKERYSYDRDFNIKLRYSTENNIYPEVFPRIKEEFQPEKIFTSISKRYLVDNSTMEYSNEFNNIGFNPGFNGIFYDKEKNLLYATLIGLDDENFLKLTDNKNDVVLINLVQKDSKEFYKDAEFIPYLDEKTNEIEAKLLDDFNIQKIKITKKIEHFIENQEQIDLYDIVLVTSIDNFQEIMKESRREFERNDMEFPILYYNMDMKFKEENVGKYADRIRCIMENHIDANEKYFVRDNILDNRMEELNNQSLHFLGILVLVTVILLNIANSYSSTNLMFFNRRREIGILLSNGMYDKDLEKMFIKNMIKDIITSIISSIVIIIVCIGSLIMTLPYLDIVKYMEMIPYAFIIGMFLIITISSYIIYYFAMKKVTGEDIINILVNY